MKSQAYYSRKQESEINQLIGPAIAAARLRLAEQEHKSGQIDNKEKDRLFSRYFHLEMDRQTKARGLRV